MVDISHTHAVRYVLLDKDHSVKKPLKAALLSALVFPGAGHFLLKKYFAGFILAGSALAGLYFLVVRVAEKALHITEKIQSGEVQLDAATITDLVAQQTSGGEAQSLDIAATVIFVCWLVGIVDSYRVGRESSVDQTPSTSSNTR